MAPHWRIAAAAAALTMFNAASAAAGCDFDPPRLAFAGSPTEQAACLLRDVRVGGALGPRLERLPPHLAARIGREVTVPREAIRRHVAARGLREAQLGGSLDAPLSRARNGAAGAPTARYFAIHDTSTPYFGDAGFPADLDGDRRINSLDRYRAAGNAVAHLFVNRRGEIFVGHDLAVPWRATKLESKVVGFPAKGLFIHVELVQPRRRDPAVADPKNNRLAPEPGFSAAQYDRLALLYIVASRRAGTWLIPAFHAAIDAGLQDGHDDPQRFSLDGLDAALGRTLGRLP